MPHHNHRAPTARRLALVSAACLGLIHLASAQAPSPELVQNGGFENGLTSWTAGGFAGNPGLESFDTGGLGATTAFGATPKLAIFSFPAYVLEQTIPVVAGQRYAFRCDVAYTAPHGAAPGADTGVLTVQCDSAIVIQRDFEVVATGETRRDALCTTFVAQRSGAVPLKFTLHKITFTTLPLARMHVDDFSVRPLDGPLVSVRGDRRPGDVVSFEVLGDPNATWLAWMDLQRLPTPAPLPGFAGALEVGVAAVLGQGQLDPHGRAQQALAIPAEPLLAGLPLAFQAASPAATTPGFGPAQDFGVQR